MSKNLKKIGYLILFLFCCFGLVRVYYKLTDDFRLANISYELPFEAPWQVPSLDSNDYEKLKHILNQDYSYIGKGAQCYAFGSKDGKYVLKFFKFKHLKPNIIVENLPPISLFKDYRDRCVDRKKRKLIGVFNGYDLAFKEHREGAQLIYLHLLPTHELNLKVKVRDKIGLSHTVDLDDVVFLVQLRGETLRSRLRHLLDNGQLSEAEEAVSSVLAMYMSEYQKGIYDHDHGVMQNTGFVDQSPFHLDVGKLNRDDRMKEIQFYKVDLQHVIWKIDMWVKINYPTFYPSFSIFLANQYHRWTGEVLNVQEIDPKLYKKRRKFFGL